MTRYVRAGAAAVVALLLCASVAAAASTSPIAVSYGPAASDHAARPSTIFLSADAGPELRHIQWSGWGGAKAIGRGEYVSSCSSQCVGARSATITLTGLYTCKNAKSRTYARGILVTAVNSAGRRVTIRFPQYAPIAYCS